MITHIFCIQSFKHLETPSQRKHSCQEKGNAKMCPIIIQDAVSEPLIQAQRYYEMLKFLIQFSSVEV